MKILVNLGFNWAYRISDWDKKWEINEAFDIMPYGYCLAADENTSIEYLKLNNFEKKLLLNNKMLLKLYFYLFKSIFCAFKYDVIWTHNDRETIFMGIIKNIPLINKFFPKVVGNIIWLTDRKLDKNKKVFYGNILKKIEAITVLSKQQVDILTNNFKLDKNKINFILYGLNKDVYSDITKINKPKNIKAINNFILMVGTDKHRDVELFKKITEKLNDEFFVFATNNEKYLNDIYSENVKVIKCTLSEMKWLYQNCKYVILPLKVNTHASGCTTLIESGLQKKVVITTESDGLNDYYLKDITVKIVKQGDLKGFIKAMNELNDDKLRLNMEQEAFNYFYCNNNFESKYYAKKFLDISKSIK